MVISQQLLERGVACPSAAMSPPPITVGTACGPASRHWDYGVTPQLTSWA